VCHATVFEDEEEAGVAKRQTTAPTTSALRGAHDGHARGY
jgi:hypothetical protein